MLYNAKMDSLLWWEAFAQDKMIRQESAVRFH